MVARPPPISSRSSGNRTRETPWPNVSRRRSKRRPRPTRVVEDVPAKSEAGEKIKGELDDLLDEIDEVLESNAEDFVKSYVQKGGQ